MIGQEIVLKKRKGVSGRVANFAKIFVPYKFEKYEWEIFSSLRHFGASLILLAAVSVVDLNAFFLKFLLWIPPRNLLNTYRLTIWFLTSIPSIREWYQYCFAKDFKPLGTQCWIVIAMIITESLLTFKFSEGLFYKPFPYEVSMGWTIAIIILIAWAIYLTLFPKPPSESKRKNKVQTQ